MSDDFSRVGGVDDFPVGSGRAVIVDGTRVAVFRLDRRWHAITDACPHMGASLAEGRLDGEHVVCGWHDRRFHLETGESNMRSGACVRVYRVRIDGDDVLLAPPVVDDAPSDDDEEWVRFDPDRFFKK